MKIEISLEKYIPDEYQLAQKIGIIYTLPTINIISEFPEFEDSDKLFL